MSSAANSDDRRHPAARSPRPAGPAGGAARAPKVAVVGAGIGGLTLAAALARHGVAAEVYEQAEQPTTAGAGIQLAPNAVRLLHRLGLTDALRVRGVHPKAIEVRHWELDIPHSAMPLGRACRELYGAPYYTLHRAHLHQALAALVGRAALRHGRRLSRVTEQPDGVRLEFADGSVRYADAVVGADGVRSVVRQVLADDRPVPSGNAIHRGLVPASRLPELARTPKVLIWTGPGKHCVCYPIDAGRTLSFAATLPEEPDRGGDESWTAEGDLEALRTAYAGWNPTVTALLAAADSVRRWSLHDREPLTRWSTERLTLLGDAAHPMLPFMAQGANQAVEDAVTLARCLRGVPADGIGDALRRYETLRLPRTTAVQLGSRGATRTLHRPVATAAAAVRIPATAGGGAHAWSPTGAPAPRTAAATRTAPAGPVGPAGAPDDLAGLRAMAWLYGYDAERTPIPPQPPAP